MVPNAKTNLELLLVKKQVNVEILVKIWENSATGMCIQMYDAYDVFR